MAGITGGPESGVGLMDYSGTGVLSGKLFADLSGFVCRSIIDKDDLQIAVSLFRYGLQATRKKSFNIVDRDDDTDQCLGHNYQNMNHMKTEKAAYASNTQPVKRSWSSRMLKFTSG